MMTQTSNAQEASSKPWKAGLILVLTLLFWANLWFISLLYFNDRVVHQDQELLSMMATVWPILTMTVPAVMLPRMIVLTVAQIRSKYDNWLVQGPLEWWLLRSMVLLGLIIVSWM